MTTTKGLPLQLMKSMNNYDYTDFRHSIFDGKEVTIMRYELPQIDSIEQTRSIVRNNNNFSKQTAVCKDATGTGGGSSAGAYELDE